MSKLQSLIKAAILKKVQQELEKKQPGLLLPNVPGADRDRAQDVVPISDTDVIDYKNRQPGDDPKVGGQFQKLQGKFRAEQLTPGSSEKDLQFWRRQHPDKHKEQLLSNLVRSFSGGAVQSTPTGHAFVGHVKTNEMRPDLEQKVREHEGNHLVFRAIEKKYGKEGKEKFLDHILSGFKPETVRHFYKKYQSHYPSYDSLALKEEIANYMHNTLSGKPQREYAFEGMPEHEMRALDQDLKGGFKRFAQSQKGIDESFFTGEKLAASELKKAPIIHEQDYDFAGTKLDDNAFNSNYHSDLTTKDIGGGLFHHTYKMRGSRSGFIHSLSYGNPEYPKSIIIGNTLDPEIDGTRGKYVANYTATEPEHQGMGLGTKLKQLALQHHGSMESDSIVSPAENRSWKKLSQYPGARVEMGTEFVGDTELNPNDAEIAAVSPHVAFYKKPKKLAASEDLEKIKAYHGTAREFDKFKLPKKSGPVLNYGTGIYASTDPKEAADFAGPQAYRRDEDAAAYHAMRSDKKFNKKLDSHARHYGLKNSRDYDHPNYDRFNADILKPHEENYLSERLGMAPHVKRVDMDIKNPFDIHNIDHAKRIAAVAGHPNSFDGMEELAADQENPIDFHDMLTDRETLGWNEGSRRSDFWDKQKLRHPNSRYDIINSLAQKAGFDGIHDKKSGMLVAFKGKQVKSIPFGKSELAKAPRRRDVRSAKDLVSFHLGPFTEHGDSPAGIRRATKNLHQMLDASPRKDVILDTVHAHESLRPVGHGRTVSPKHVGNPIIIGKLKDGHHVLLDGNHRLIHAKETGLPTIKATIYELSDDFSDLIGMDSGVGKLPKKTFKKSQLAKAPIKYEGEVFNHPQKVKTSEEKPFVNEKTIQALPNGLTHKILHGDRKTIHELYDKDKLVGALTVVNNQVRDSQVSSEEQGRNYGKSLYSAALRHHGQLESDTLVSPAAAHQWQRLGAMNNVDYRPAPYLTNEEYSNWINEGMNPDSPHEPFKAQVTGQLDDKEAFPQVKPK